MTSWNMSRESSNALEKWLVGNSSSVCYDALTLSNSTEYIVPIVGGETVGDPALS